MEGLADEFLSQPDDLQRLQAFEAAVDVAAMMPFKVRLWQPQNTFYAVLMQKYDEFRARAAQNDEAAQTWMKSFLALGAKLSVYVGS